MSRVVDGVSWSGSSVAFLLFVVADKAEIAAEAVSVLQLDLLPDSVVRVYDLEDEGRILGGRRTFEVDTTVNELPPDLPSYLRSRLSQALAAGVEVAWFGFEGSFNFNDIFTPYIADQIFGVAHAGRISLALEDDEILSGDWRDFIVGIGEALRGR